jgi:hypothetical protein
VTPAPTPTPNAALEAARACEQSFREQVYNRYRPAYCSGMPPCVPKSEEEVRALISLDIRSAPIIGFTYTVGNLCSTVTYFGRANFAPPECTLRDFTIDREATQMVPC